MNVSKMQEQLGIDKIPNCFHEMYKEIEDCYMEHAQEILSESFLTKTLDSCKVLVDYRESIIEAGERILQNEALCLLVCLLEQWVIQNENLPSEEYTPPVGEGVEYDLLHLFPGISRIPDNLAYLKARKVPIDVIYATMGEYDFCVELLLKAYRKPAFNFGRLCWINRLIHNRLIRIDRFKYDMPGNYLTGACVYKNKEGDYCVLANNIEVYESGRVLGSVGHADTAKSYLAEIIETKDKVIGHCVVDGIVQKGLTELSKEEWSLCLSEKDPVLRIHIPPTGAFDEETLQKSYDRAREIMATCYPDFEYKAFFCGSWLMSQELEQVLKPISNILGFQRKFMKVPFRSTGTAVFSFVFSLGAKIPEDISALPEDTSLQRGIKRLYENGGFLHEGAGVFF